MPVDLAHATQVSGSHDAETMDLWLETRSVLMPTLAHVGGSKPRRRSVGGVWVGSGIDLSIPAASSRTQGGRGWQDVRRGG